MSLQTTLQSLLAPLASGGAYSLQAMQGVQPPFIVWQRVVSTVNNNIQGASDVQNTRVQIDSYALTYAAATALADQVAIAILADLNGLQLTEQDLYEPEVKLYRVMQDFSFWST